MATSELNEKPAARTRVGRRFMVSSRSVELLLIRDLRLFLKSERRREFLTFPRPTRPKRPDDPNRDPGTKRMPSLERMPLGRIRLDLRDSSPHLLLIASQNRGGGS